LQIGCGATAAVVATGVAVLVRRITSMSLPFFAETLFGSNGSICGASSRHAAAPAVLLPHRSPGHDGAAYRDLLPHWSVPPNHKGRVAAGTPLAGI